MYILKKINIAIIACLISPSIFATSANNQPLDFKQEKATISHNTTADEETSESPFSGSLALTTNYIFRGVSASNNLPAVQGSLTYTNAPTGLYLNVWSSNTYIQGEDGNTANIEIDTIAGISNPIGDHFEYNLSVGRYFYPKAQEFSYNEAILNLGFYFLTATAAYSANEFNVHKPGFYYNAGVKFDIPCVNPYLDNMNVTATIGRFNLPKEAGNSYNDYAISLNKDISNYTLSIQWTDTNHKLLNNSQDHSHIVGTVTANF